ncbi:O-phosphoserine--tRNA ligase [Candidatus Altiarchaeota archaeon]
MARFDIEDIKKKAKLDFEKTWLDTAKLNPKKSVKDYVGVEGRPHILHSLIQQVRQVFLDLGFEEVENQVFVSEEDVYKQYGPEAPVILDRCYYLAGLPRPDIGLSKDKINELQGIKKGFDVEGFQKILREYRAGSIEGDNLLEVMVQRLNLSTGEAAKIIDIFPEFKDIMPVAGKSTLRSHMTASWFPTLAAMVKTRELPLLLFSIGMRFRREQKIDATHLRAHYGASCVIVDEEMSLDSGKQLTEKILKKIDFTNLEYVKKEATSNYYTPEMEYEVYSGKIEVADIGMYSPVALANYDIPYPVFNLGFGLERVLMIKTGVKDVREILYPQFYSKVSFTDQDLLGELSLIQKPTTPEGVKLAEAIKDVAKKEASQKSPCSFEAFKGKISGREVEVSIVEKEEGSLLLGPAALNKIYVFDSGIYGVPEDTSKLKASLSDIKDKGLNASFSFLDAIANYFAAEIEREIKDGNKKGFLQIKMVKTPGEVNIKVSETARRFIESKNKPLSLKGPVFTAVEFKAEG